MSLVIEDSILSQIKLSESELKLEIAIYLYTSKKLTLSRASKLAVIDRIAFQKQLAARQIPIHYSVSDLEKDMETIRLFHKQ